MPLLLRAGLRYYLHHKWQALLALIGVALGVAIVLAVDLASHTATHSFEQSAMQIKGSATHRIIGASGDLDEDIFTLLATSLSSAPIAPIISHWVDLSNDQRDATKPLQLLGLDPFFEKPFDRSTGNNGNRPGTIWQWFNHPNGTLIPQSLADQRDLKKGDPLTILFKGSPVTLVIIGFHSMANNLLLADIATVQEVTQEFGRISYIDVIASDQMRNEIEALLPASVRIIVSQRDIDGISQLSDAFQLNLTALSLLALLVGMFLIFNAISFSFVQRRVLIGRLRAIGITQGELFRLLLIETLILGALGCLIGVFLGFWLGAHLTQLVAGTINELYFRVTVEGLAFHWIPLVKALVLGIIGTILAALYPVYQATSAPPISALSRAYLEQKTKNKLPLLSTVGFTLISAGLLMAQIEIGGLIGAFIGIFVMILGATLLTPLLFHLCNRSLRKLPLPLIGRMAIRDIDRHLSRLSIAGAALMVALAAGMGIGIMVGSMRLAVTDWLTDLLNADIYVTHEQFDAGALLTPDEVEQLIRLPAVRASSIYRHRSIRISEKPLTLVAAQLSQLSKSGFSLISAKPDKAWQQFDQGKIIISEPLAYRLRLKEGDKLNLPTDKGLHAFTVAAIFRDYASEHGRIFITHDHYLAYWNDPLIGSIALMAEPFQSNQLTQQIRRLPPLSDQLSITYGKKILQQSQAIFNRTFRITEVLHLLALSIAFIGVLSALMALQLERAKEYAVLRSLGFTPRQMAGLINLGALSLGIVASLASIPTGLMMAWLLVNTVQHRAFGWTLPFEVDAPLLLQSIGIGVLAAVLASLYPAWQTAHSKPASQLREE